MNVTTKNITFNPTSDTGALTALRALNDERVGSLEDMLLASSHQAKLLRDLLPVPAQQIPGHLTSLIPSILVEYIADMPMPGVSFWANKCWHIHVRSTEPIGEQVFTVLHQLKKIIDHPLRQRTITLSHAEWENLANYFANQVLARESSPAASRGERRIAYE